MAKDREPPSLADFVVTALSPILIMGLVGSLAYFLLEVLYAGQWPDRLRWTLFFFVVGACWSAVFRFSSARPRRGYIA